MTLTQVMRVRPMLCGALLAHAVVVFTPQAATLSTWIWVSLGLLMCAATCGGMRTVFVSMPIGRTHLGTLAWVLLAMSLAVWLCAQRLWWRLDDALASTQIDRVARVTLRITELPQLAPSSRRFRAQVLHADAAGIPQHVFVSWFAPDRHDPFTSAPPWPFPDLVPGQVWRMVLNMRPPSGERNPHGFDVEGYWFAQGVRAIGRVRGSPVLLRDDGWVNIEIAAQRLRHHVRTAMQPYVSPLRYGAVLTALAIGDQAGVSSQDWQVFNRSGITHLVSISGSHITMLAVLGGLGTLWLWKRLRWRKRYLAERIPAQLASAWVALGIAWLYCLLAGWGVPAQRTFVMLAILALAYSARLPLISSRIWLLAAFAVVLLDPWALMSNGFCLSFAAVAVLMASRAWMRHTNTPAFTLGRGKRLVHGLWFATRLQLAISVTLMPLLARLFHEISLVSPLANAYAIPVIGWLVTPFALLLALLACIPGAEGFAQTVAWLAHRILAGIMQPTQALAALPAASVSIPAVPWTFTLLAVLGLVWSLLPTGFAIRRFACVCVLPALFWRAETPVYGDWRLTVLDTGQSGAAVLQTQNHVLLFDTGKRSSPDAESGSRTIVPFLRSQGIRQLDTVVISHQDLDHVGGASGVLRAMPVRETFSSFDLAAWLRREARLLGSPDDLTPQPQQSRACVAGQQWQVDGVSFTFLWPPAHYSGSLTHNARSCVLLVRGAHHAILLTGDMGAAQEAALLQHGFERLSPIDVVLAPHHGSRFASSRAFVHAAQPKHVIAQAGLWNPFGHPHPDTVRRWQHAGAQFWRTDWDGAVQVQSAQGVLTTFATRERWPRYWQLPCTVRQTCTHE